MSIAIKPLSQWAVGVERTIQSLKRRPLKGLTVPGGRLEYAVDAHSLWVLLHLGHKGGSKGVVWAVRTCYDPQGAVQLADSGEGRDGRIFFELEGGLGRFRVELQSLSEQSSLIRYTAWLTPRADTTIQAMPRDLYLLGKDLDPGSGSGRVLGKQNANGAAFAFFTQEKPAGAAGLYFQQLTSLNGYFEATETDAKEVVGGDWPEIGLALPTTKKPLPKGLKVCISDGFLRCWDTPPASETIAARWFLDGMAEIYPHLDRPETSYFDWPAMAGKTLRSMGSKYCRREINGHLYFNAYVGSERKPPESMVQFALLVPLLEYDQWRGRPNPLPAQMISSIPTFYDPGVGSTVRWLPGEQFDNEGGEPSEEEHTDLIDSWYLYHVMLNLARLAEMGIAEADRLLRDSLPYVIRVARHFEYQWPVFFKLKTLAVEKAETAPGAGGEQDVPGLYVKLMMLAHQLYGDETYIGEAELAARKLRGLGFDLLYQTNNTMFSGDGLLRLWKATGNREYLELSIACIANVVAKMWIWECDYGHAKHYTTFMGVAPLQDCEYVAAYEEAESFATALAYLQELGEQTPASVDLLLSEYMKYTLARSRYYFPTELPEEAVSPKPREGHLERDLAIPLEDIRTGWHKAGQVGQEVYGAATPFVLATHAYTHRKQVPFLVYSEYPLVFSDYRSERRASGTFRAKLCGSPTLQCRLRVIPLRNELPQVALFIEGDSPRLKAKIQRADRSREYMLPGGSEIRIEWKTRPKQ